MGPSTEPSDSKVWAAVLALGLEEQVSGDAVAVNAYSRLPAESAPPEGTREQIPDITGYRIVSRLGEGGMGTVWRAVQLSTHREVALKLMTAGRFGSDRARQRFEREIELAARLEHPHIARVYDSGSCDGLWYYAMELVEGANLDRYVADKKLLPRAILALMRDVCQAVHYAHQRGVIHRDIKPSNILVSADGHAHVVDFGLAKALADEPNDLTLTQEGQYAGTPAFMSPEQAAGKHELIDTRADVYGLGATLYLLLTDHTPHAMNGPRYEVLRSIATEEVRRPRLMNKSLNVELESLLLKALAHDPEQRYGSAAELAEDITRYLDGDALKASPTTAAYRLRKFVHKHRVPLTVAAGFALVLMLATIISTWQAVRATAEKRRADQQAAIAEAVNEFLNKDLLGQASAAGQATPDRIPDRDLKVRDALDRAAERIPGRFEKQPLVEAAIRYSIGGSYQALGEFAKAETQLATALQMFRASDQAQSPDTFECVRALAKLHIQNGRYDESVALLLDALDMARRVFGEDAPDTLRVRGELGLAYAVQGDLAKAEPLLLQAAEKLGSGASGDDNDASEALGNLAHLYMNRGEFAKAEPFSIRAVELSKKKHGEHHPSTLMSIGNLSWLYMQQKRFDVAEPLIHQLLEKMEQVQGPEHPDTLHVLQMLGTLYSDTARPDLAREVLVRALVKERRILGDHHTLTLNTMDTLAGIYAAQGQLVEAEAMYRQTLSGKRSTLGPRHRWTIFSLNNLTMLLYNQKRYTEAEPLLRELLTGEVPDDYKSVLPKLRKMLASLEAATQPSTQTTTAPQKP